MSLNQLIEVVDMRIKGMLRSNLQELDMNAQQQKLAQIQKRELRKMLRKCGTGDLLAKQYVKQIIKEILFDQICLTKDEMNILIPLKTQQQMDERDMFECMMFVYKKKYGVDALVKWMEDYDLNLSNEDGNIEGEITCEQLRTIYMRGDFFISDIDWIELIVQRVYSEYRGLGVIDEIRDMAIDGVSGGVSGNSRDERSIWIMIGGKSIYLSFLSFGTAQNLERICRTIYRHGNPGQLSRSRGYIVNEMADHARVVVARPDFSEHWVFFVRKLDNLKSIAIEDLYTGMNAQIATTLLCYIIRGGQTIGITGQQGTGKTTLLMSLIAFIPNDFTLRIQETAFELQLRRLYPCRNIVSFRETSRITAQEGLNLQKKTDGTVSIIGEVVNAAQASLMLQLGQTASLYTIFTHHANSTRHLIWALQNNLLQEGQFTREDIAQQQVVDVVRFHIHLEKDAHGKRYIAYISEIKPREEMDKDGTCYEERVLLKHENGTYKVQQMISEETSRCMELHGGKEAREVYEKKMLQFLQEYSDCQDSDVEDETVHASLLPG